MGFIKDFINYKIKYDSVFRKETLKLKELEQLDISEIKDLENRALVSHIKNAHKKSSFYRDLYNKHGVEINQIQNKSDLKNLPIVTKELIKNRVKDIYIGNPLLRYKGSTSGTSGSPLTTYYSKSCINKEAAYVENFYNNAGFFLGNKGLSLRGTLDKNQEEYFNRYSNILYMSSYNLTKKNIDFYFKKIHEFKPKAIFGYPSSLETISNLFLENNLSADIPLAFTSSETLYSYQKEKIKKALNAKIFDLYGNAERSVMLVQREPGGCYLEPYLYAVNEFEKTYFLSTNVFNRDFPLIRYKVEDSVHIQKGKIVSINGRSDDMLKLKNGGSIGSAALSLAFRNVENLRFSQIIQLSLDLCHINIVVTGSYGQKDKEKLVYNLEKYIGDKIDYIIKEVNEDEIVKSNKGKFKLIINKVQ